MTDNTDRFLTPSQEAAALLNEQMNVLPYLDTTDPFELDGAPFLGTYEGYPVAVSDLLFGAISGAFFIPPPGFIAANAVATVSPDTQQKVIVLTRQAAAHPLYVEHVLAHEAGHHNAGHTDRDSPHMSNAREDATEFEADEWSVKKIGKAKTIEALRFLLDDGDPTDEGSDEIRRRIAHIESLPE